MAQQSTSRYLPISRRIFLPLLLALFCRIPNASGSSLLPDPTTGIGYHKHAPKPSAFKSTVLNPTQDDLNRAVDFGRDVIDRLHLLESNLVAAEVYLKAGTPAHRYMLNAKAGEAAAEQGKSAHIAARATYHLMAAACDNLVPRPRCSAHVQATYSLGNTSVSPHCPATRPPACPTSSPAYRSYDGSCTNPLAPALGRSNTQYKRLIFPDYVDGVQAARRSVAGKGALPSARAVSVGLVQSAEDAGNKEASGLTLMAMAWAYVVGADVGHTVVNSMVHTEKAIDCCSETGDTLKPRYLHPFCQTIEIPGDDPHYAKRGIACMNYVRSMPAVNGDCTFGPHEQLNQATHFLDASHLYGNDEKRARSLRTFQRGQLLTTSINGQDMLPVVVDDEECSKRTCFTSGDSRVNYNPQYTSMYTIFVREHNRIADQLADINPTWADEQLFQTARKIIIAEVQHITYEDWLKFIIGQKYLDKMSSSKYVDTADPSVSNSFVTAAFRFPKSLMKSNITLLEENRTVSKIINILEYFNDPTILEEPGFLDSLIRSMATERSEKSDFYYSKDLTNDPFGNGKIGLDIVSLDIQRGRDHGLPGYTAYRAKCGLPMVNTFEELGDFISTKNIGKLSKIYASPNDIDLFVGGMMEESYNDHLLGPTFSCIIADQMKRTRQGDRYFYTNSLQPDPFTAQQLEAIRKTTLAKIICNNAAGIHRMARNVFLVISDTNPLENCEDIPDLDLALWKEKRT